MVRADQLIDLEDQFGELEEHEQSYSPLASA